uniref:Ubiquitin-like domain-containing protein n=1 Tax=Panagrolaimus sp. ES5 TaxID=591445 RepID=A0AC34GWE6_9BILA
MLQYIELTIMNENGDITKADVNVKNSVKYIQLKIQNVCGIPLNLQRFTCDDATLMNESSEDDSDENGCSNSTVPEEEDVTNVVSALDNIRLQSENAIVEIQNSDSGCDLTHDIEEQTDEEVKTILYFTVKNDAGESFIIDVEANEMVETLMLKIQDTCGISLKRQRFTCFDVTTLSDEFWENEYEKLSNDIRECREDTADMMAALESFNFNNDDAVADVEKEQEVNTWNTNEKATPAKDAEEEYVSVKIMHALSDLICYGDGKTLDLKDPKLKILLVDELFATKNTVASPFGVSSLISKIFKCNLQTMDIYNQTLTSREYNFLTHFGTLEFVKIRNCTIKYEDGTTVTVDTLLNHLKKLIKFEMHYSDMSSMFQNDTVEKLVKILPRFKKLRCFGLYGLTKTFDISSFSSFFKVNTNVDVRLEYKQKLSVEYIEMLDEIMQDFVENPPKKIPYIRFPGYKKVKYARYENAYKLQNVLK